MEDNTSKSPKAEKEKPQEEAPPPPKETAAHSMLVQLERSRSILGFVAHDDADVTEAWNCGQEVTAQEALELLIELAGTEPRFLRRQLVDVVGSMLQIAEAETLEEGTRHLAVEFVITLALSNG